MIQPDFKTFSGLARQGNLVPVYETYTADLLTPVGAHLRIARDAQYSFLLESVEGGEKIGRYTFTGANPEEVFRSRGRQCTLETGKKQVRFEGDPVEHLRRLTQRYRPVRVPGLPPLIAGAIGYFAYDMVRLVERIPATGRDDVGVDDCVMMFYHGLLAFDHVQHRVWVIRNVFTEDLAVCARDTMRPCVKSSERSDCSNGLCHPNLARPGPSHCKFART
jgi:anthranilate synthase component I